jgi:TonB family protein
VTLRVEPEYTPEARAAKYQGTVVVNATVHQDGSLTVNEVLQELDYGLTPKAIEALEQWKFDPAKKDGQDVSVSLKIEVNFNLK